MDFLQNILETTEFPVVTAFILGIMTAVSPCPMATNITAIGFISKDIKNKRTVFMNGVIYTIGRAITYTLIGIIFYFGAGQFQISGALQQWGERLLGPLLIVIGLFMLGVINLKIFGGSAFVEKFENKKNFGFWSVLLLGIAFALAFCPYSGVLYFGMLIPITVKSASGLFLPVVYALATGIPVIIFAWVLAFSVGSLGNVYNKMKSFEKWFRRVVAILFLIVGLYYTIHLIFF